MKIGWYPPAGMQKAPLLKEVGYDYVELGLAPLNIEDREAGERAKAQIKALPLPVLAFNNLYPRDMRVVDPGLNAPRLKSYLSRVAEFLQSAGAQVVVMGSAWSRNLPEGADKIRAREQLLQTLSWAANALEGSGVVLALEPQNYLECNFIQLLSEAVNCVKQVNRPEIRVTADFYHMVMGKEHLELLKDEGVWIGHVQVSDSDRLNPGTGSYPYDEFMRNLKAGGYAENISVECMIELPQSAMQSSLAFLRSKVST